MMLDAARFAGISFMLLPLLVGLVGLCLLSRFPRAGRGMAAVGLSLLAAGPVVDLLWLFVLDFALGSAGLYDLSTLLTYAAPFMTATALLLLGLAATRGTRGAPATQPGPGGPPPPGPWQGAPGPPPPGAFPPRYNPEQHQHGPHGGA